MVESGVPSSCAAAAARPSSARELLVARERELGRGQRVGELAGFVRDAVGVGGDEDDAADQRDPDADDVDVGRRRCARSGSQGSGRWKTERTRGDDRRRGRRGGRSSAAAASSPTPRPAPGAAARTGSASPPVSARRPPSCSAVVGELRRGEGDAGPVAGAEAEDEPEIEQRPRARSAPRHSISGSGKPRPKSTKSTPDGLAGDRQPAQADQRIEPHRAPAGWRDSGPSSPPRLTFSALSSGDFGRVR